MGSFSLSGNQIETKLRCMVDIPRRSLRCFGLFSSRYAELHKGVSPFDSKACVHKDTILSTEQACPSFLGAKLARSVASREK